MAARALGRMNVDIAFVQQANIMDPAYETKEWAGYNIRDAAAGSEHCRGVTLTVGENDAWTFTMDNEKVVGNNVISSQAVVHCWVLHSSFG